MGKEICKVIGGPDGLQFEFELAEGNRRKGLAWGKGRLLVLGEPLWIGEDDESAVEWSWLDLFEFLAESWPWLMLEESYPIPINPSELTDMGAAARRRWDGLSEAIVDDEDEALIRFGYRHDLALGLKGVYLPTILLLRQGLLCQVGIPEWGRTHVLPFAHVKSVLEELGDWIADVIRGGGQARADRALALWGQRTERVRTWRARICSGMSPEELDSIRNGQDPDAFLEIFEESAEEGSELAMAARMAPGGLGAKGKREVIEAVRALPRRNTPELDGLSKDAVTLLVDPDTPPFEQGYLLAGWLREQFGLKRDAVPDPEYVLSGWGVELQDVVFEHASERLEAVAAWGRLHGPGVLINTSPGALGVHPHRRRTSLAHEICHLLVDRSGGLPLAEVLGGRAPAKLEQRAKAFAAEFLLPRSVAADAVRTGAALQEVIDELSVDFNLSRELVAWQITNSEAYVLLHREERDVLARVLRW